MYVFGNALHLFCILELTISVTIIAIGSFYTTCTLSEEQGRTAEHEVGLHSVFALFVANHPLTPRTRQIYFQHAVLETSNHSTQHSLNGVRTLLVQCFYLLATCQTDRYYGPGPPFVTNVADGKLDAG